jgi:hypothetical protein
MRKALRTLSGSCQPSSSWQHGNVARHEKADGHSTRLRTRNEKKWLITSVVGQLRLDTPVHFSLADIVSVDGTGDLEQDADVWSHRIRGIMSDRFMAFQQAAELREQLKHLT